MKALTFHGTETIRYETAQDPGIEQPGDVIFRVELAAICGSDMHVYHGRETGVNDVVNLVHGDALDHLNDLAGISFCFLDSEKEIYSDCYEAIIPKMVPGGILVADNAISHELHLKPMIDRALSDDRVDALVVPIGKGELVCRRK